MSQSIHKRIERTPEELARLAAIREQTRQERLAGTSPADTSEYEGPVQQAYGVAIGRLASRLKGLREKAGLSLSDLEQRTGLDREALSMLEAGQTTNPSLYSLWRYALGLGQWGDFVALDLAQLFYEPLQATRQAEAASAQQARAPDAGLPLLASGV